MAIYEYQCPEGHLFEVVRPMKEGARIDSFCPSHGNLGEWAPPLVHTKFTYTPGRETGVYKLDYGTFATHDLTPPGKFERLRRAGTVADPFAEFDSDVKSGRRERYAGAIDNV